MVVSDIKNEALNAIDKIVSATDEQSATRLIALQDIREHLEEKIEELGDDEDEDEPTCEECGELLDDCICDDDYDDNDYYDDEEEEICEGCGEPEYACTCGDEDEDEEE